MSDLSQFAVDTAAVQWSPGPVPGTEVLKLHEFESEQVQMLRLERGAAMPSRAVPRGEEIYVVSGQISDIDGDYDADAWIRNPSGNAAAFEATQPSVLWIKSGHLHPEYGPAKVADDK
jgi:hypothetical protein